MIPALPPGLEPIEVLGRGPLTVVVHCRDAGRHVVVKAPAPGTADPDLAAEALRTEARIRSTVTHPGVLPLIRVDGQLLVAPFFPDGTLAPRLPAGLNRDVALSLIDQIAAALDALHAAGWVHADLNATNILCDWAGGRFVLADFGAARAIGARPSPRRQVAGQASAPEALRGMPATIASDVFALGRLADRCLPGGRPAEVISVLRRGTDPDPGRRAPTAGDLATSLRRAWPDTTVETARPASVNALAARLAELDGDLPPGERLALRELLRRAEYATARGTTALTALTVETFGRAEALAVFEEAGLAHALGAGPATAARVAARCGLAAEPTRIVLDLMAAESIVVRTPTTDDDATYRLSPPIAALYAGGDPARPIGQARRFWAELSHWLYTGTAAAPMDADRTGAGYRDAVTVLGAASAPDAEALAGILAGDPGIGAARWIADIGGGSGVWGRSLRPVAPYATVVVLDRPEVLAGLDMPDAWAVAADWRALPLAPYSMDVVVLANVCHLEDAPGAARLIAASADRLRPGGRLLVVDAIGDPLDRGALLQSMHLGLRTRRGRVHSAASYRRWCGRAGLVAIGAHRLPSGFTALVCGASSPGIAQRGRGQERPERAVVDDPRQPPGHTGEEVGHLDPRIVPGIDRHQPDQR